jgi:hypothetical protein
MVGTGRLTILLVCLLLTGLLMDARRVSLPRVEPLQPPQPAGWQSAPAPAPEGFPADGGFKGYLYYSPFGEAMKLAAVRFDALDRALDPSGAMRTGDWRRTADYPTPLGNGRARLQRFRTGDDQIVMLEWMQRAGGDPSPSVGVHRPWRSLVADIPLHTLQLLREPNAWLFRVYGVAQPSDRGAQQVYRNIRDLAEKAAASPWRKE